MSLLMFCIAYGKKKAKWSKKWTMFFVKPLCSRGTENGLQMSAQQCKVENCGVF